MTRAKDNTLISRLGFNDPDRSSNLHTLACQYLCRPENVAKVLSRVVGDAPAVASYRSQYSDGTEEAWSVDNRSSKDPMVLRVPGFGVAAGPWLDVEAETEVVVASGRNGFVSGFIDVRIVGRLGRACAFEYFSGETRVRKIEEGSFRDDTIVAVREVTENKFVTGVEYDEGPRYQHRHTLLVEVKTNRIDVAQIAMQLGVYEAKYSAEGAIHMVAALTWRLHPDEKAQLAAKGYHVIWLGPPFEKYCEERRNSSAVADEEAF